MKQNQTTGGCQCGALRYEFQGAPRAAEICHCRMCQKAFGNWGAAFIEVPLANFNWIKEKPATFHSSARVARGFCAKCGTPLSMYEAGEDFIDLAAGTLDDPSGITFTRQIGIESRLPWFKTLHQLPEFETSATRSAEDLIRLASRQFPDKD